jgi:putative component of membrane protein insertase Oxa1/YidC/SpoIIIJ protein YidD
MMLAWMLSMSVISEGSALRVHRLIRCEAIFSKGIGVLLPVGFEGTALQKTHRLSTHNTLEGRINKSIGFGVYL